MSDIATEPNAMRGHEPMSMDLTTPGGDVHRLVYAFDRASPVQDAMHTMIRSGSFYEPETTILLASVLKPGDVFVDVGAHVGYFSVLAAALVGVAGQVVSFEPEPGNYAQLIEHVRLNALTQVLPIHCAAGATAEVRDLHCNADNDGGHALWDVRTHPYNDRSRIAPRTHPVFVTTLDAALGAVVPGRIKAIKIDVEGNEHAVLRGARRTLELHRVPFVIAEVNRLGLEQMGTSQLGLRTFMTMLGYDTWLLQAADPQLIRLDAGQLVETVDGDGVFNLLFRLPGAVIG
ncbi:MAG: FkbM family methyltransferase [Gemmatimonadaceae bacterium]